MVVRVDAEAGQVGAFSSVGAVCLGELQVAGRVDVADLTAWNSCGHREAVTVCAVNEGGWWWAGRAVDASLLGAVGAGVAAEPEGKLVSIYGEVLNFASRVDCKTGELGGLCVASCWHGSSNAGEGECECGLHFAGDGCFVEL